jgi:hypothetical protein
MDGGNNRSSGERKLMSLNILINEGGAQVVEGGAADYEKFLEDDGMDKISNIDGISSQGSSVIMHLGDHSNGDIKRLSGNFIKQNLGRNSAMALTKGSSQELSLMQKSLSQSQLSKKGNQK